MTKHIRTEWADVTYTIQISEQERLILVEALENWGLFPQLHEFFLKTLPETRP